MKRRSRKLCEFTVAGADWEVWLVKPDSEELQLEDGTSGEGMCNWQQERIYLNRELSFSKMRTTLAHELLHLLFYFTKLEADEDREHDFIALMQNPMREVLTNNPMDSLTRLAEKEGTMAKAKKKPKKPC